MPTATIDTAEFRKIIREELRKVLREEEFALFISRRARKSVFHRILPADYRFRVSPQT